MPTKGYFLKQDNFLYLEERAAEKKISPSAYLNELLDQDRGEVPQDMSNAEKVVIPAKIVAIPKEGKHAPLRGDGLHTCKKCGYMLPYYKGKCKMCG